MAEIINRDWVWNLAPQGRTSAFPQVRLPRPGENVTGQIVSFPPQEVIDNCYRRSTPEFREKRTEKKTLVVGIGGRARHGKDTVAEHIINVFGQPDSPSSLYRNALVIKSYGFADELKIELFDWIQTTVFFEKQNCFGRPPLGLDFLPCIDVLYSRAEKLKWINHHKDELRAALQLLGTEFRRKQRETYWIEKTKKQIEEERPQIAILRDLRFANEASICDVTICVERLGYKEADENVGKHVSETELTSIPFDYRIAVPDGKLGLLKSEAEVAFQQIIDKFL